MPSAFAGRDSRGLWTYLAILIVAAFAMRCGAVAGLRNIHQFHGRSPAGADAVEFNQIGLNLAAGKGYATTPGYPTAFRSPGFPLFLGAVYSLSYENYPLVYFALILIGVVTCLLTYAAAREVLTENFALLAGLLTAVYLPHVYFSTIFMSEGLFALCVALALWSFLLYLRKRSGWMIAITGLAVGYAALCRPIGLLFVIFLAPALVQAAGWKLAPLLRSLVPFGLAVVAVIFPWTLRNYNLFHHWGLIATNGGSTFYGANNDTTLHDKAYRGGWIATNYLPGRKEIDAQPDEYTHDQMEWKLGKAWVSAHLADLPLTTVYKVAGFWFPDTTSANRKFVLMQLLGYTPFGIAILIGLVLSLVPLQQAAKPAWLALHGILLADLASSVVFYGCARFRDSVTPVLMIYAAFALARAYAWWSGAGEPVTWT
jgi:4-amino-4-deoxy-L-arabinose transferase-like glycosyltransferase